MITYKNYTIEEETEPWALKYGMKFKFFRDRNDDHYFSASSIEECKEQIDELVNEEIS